MSPEGHCSVPGSGWTGRSANPGPVFQSCSFLKDLVSKSLKVSVGTLILYCMGKPRGVQASSDALEMAWAAEDKMLYGVTCNLVVSLCRSVSLLSPSQDMWIIIHWLRQVYCSRVLSHAA